MDDLIEFLRRNLSPEDLAGLEGIGATDERDYEALIRRVGLRLKMDEEQYSFARSRLEAHYKDLGELPLGRRLTILRNSSPALLLILFRHLIAQSYGERFGDRHRSLQLALLASEVAEVISGTGYLGPADWADLRAELLLYLGNARRINSDLQGARRCFLDAERWIDSGTGDRALKADFLSFYSHVLVSEGQCPEAATLLDREIALRRLLGDEAKFAFALVQRGWVSSLMIEEPVTKVIDSIKAAMPLVKDDHRLTLQAIHALAERLARDGFGYQAVKFLGSVLFPLHMVNEERFQIQHVWIEGIACRALRELSEAESLLRKVRADLARLASTHKLAIASLDLAAVFAAQGKYREAKHVAEEAYSLFQAEGLEKRALAAVVLLREATEAKRVTEGLAVAVANFLARFPYNKALRFEWKDE